MVTTDMSSPLQKLRAPALVGGIATDGTRRCRTQLGSLDSGGSGYVLNGTSNLHRIPYTSPKTTSSWRIAVANRWAGDQVNSAGAGTGTVTFTDLWIGEAAFGTDGFPNGQFVPGTSQQLISGTWALPTNGADYLSSWFTYPLTRGKTYILSTPAVVSNANHAEQFTGAWWVSGSTANVSADNPASMAMGYGIIPGDWRIDYRYTDGAPAGLWLGPSIMAGFSNSKIGGVQTAACHVRASYPQRYATRNNHGMSVSAIAGSRTADFTDATGWRWARLELANLHVDYVVVGELPTNDAQSLAAPDGAGIASGLRTLITTIRTQLPGRPIFLATGTPLGATTAKQSTLNAATAANATTFVSVADLGASGTKVRVGVGWQGELRTTTARSGTGPYTYTVPALTYAHAAGDRIMGSIEAARTVANELIRQRGLDIDGVIDLDAAVRLQATPGVVDPEWADADKLHIQPPGHVMLDMACQRGINPLGTAA